jgi:hypothetical protein
MKVMCIMYHSVLKNRLNPGMKTAAGLRHGVRLEVAHYLLGCHQQGGYNVVRGFIDK